MESRTASLYFSFMVVGFANFKLIVAALHIRVKTFVGNDFFLCHGYFLVMPMTFG